MGGVELCALKCMKGEVGVSVRLLVGGLYRAVYVLR